MFRVPRPGFKAFRVWGLCRFGLGVKGSGLRLLGYRAEA